MIDEATLRRDVARFQTPVLHRSISQIVTSFGGFIAVCAAMYALYETSIWLTLALAPLAAGFMVRIFIIQHDCGHYAFFKSRRANDLMGALCSIVTFTPYTSWRRQHAGHHGIWNDLDRRQSGADIYSSCLTVSEYRDLDRKDRWIYRATRHPLIANILIPPFIFFLLYRTPFDMPKSWRHERRVVHLTTLALVVMLVGLGLLLGFDAVAAVHIPIVAIAAVIGVWLFSVQHIAEKTLWARNRNWSFTAAALEGSTYLALPSWLQWFTGNIGFHHVHHLNPRIPNYRLQECHESIALLQSVPKVSLMEGLRSVLYVLWDEDRETMVTFRQLSQGAA